MYGKRILARITILRKQNEIFNYYWNMAIFNSFNRGTPNGITFTLSFIGFGFINCKLKP